MCVIGACSMQIETVHMLEEERRKKEKRKYVRTYSSSHIATSESRLAVHQRRCINTIK